MQNPIAIAATQFETELAALRAQLAKIALWTANAKAIELGPTPRQVVAQIGGATLYAYNAKTRPTTPKRPPILIVFALLNRPEILDLETEKSVVADLLAAGHTVYLLDWGTPDQTKKQTLSDYVDEQLAAAINNALQYAGKRKLVLMGICQGGVMSLLASAQHQAKVAGLITVVSPFDCKTRGDRLAQWIRKIDTAQLRRIGKPMSGAALNESLRALKPVALSHTKYLSMLNANTTEGDFATFIRLERWLKDSPDLAIDAFCDFIDLFYHRNALQSSGKNALFSAADIKKISTPVLNIYASNDHIVPNSASKALRKLVPLASYKAVCIRAGHIGIFINDQARKTLVTAVDEWMRKSYK